MQLDETLFDITEDLNLDFWMCSAQLAGEETWGGTMDNPSLEPMLASRRMPGEQDLRAIEAQAASVQHETYIEDRRTFRSPNLYLN